MGTRERKIKERVRRRQMHNLQGGFEGREKVGRDVKGESKVAEEVITHGQARNEAI